jgi:rhamnosyltransferase
MGAPTGRVLGILITYHPDPSTLERVFASIEPQVDRLLVVDNASTEGSRRSVTEAAHRAAGHSAIGDGWLELIVNARNEGVAVAFNQGISRAIADGYEFVLLLDQDSQARPGAVAALKSEFRSLSSQFPVGALQAFNVEPGGRVPIDIRRREFYRRHGGFDGPNAFEGLLLLNSGALIPTSVLRAVGGFDPRYFVDLADYEFSLRLAQRGFRVFHVPAAILDHNIGESGPPSPARLYYAVRELVKLIVSYGRSHPGGVAPPTWTTLNRIASMTIRSGHPFGIVRLSVRGIFEGLLGVNGERLISERLQPPGS